ncbi:PREDICTED: gap junction alpha-9 protein [Nanorana parkeri]|uniref:gap junction alpha-9 protein n=1 Tax=Nanorana parkeri TaxID=125878 RepID=UPI000853F50C|nr:PREDICTED: gap junction alpha-9 protein [Nanorana parkeri]
MGDWNFLGVILEEVHIHSTIVGKIWLTILFIFRMLVLGVAAEEVWNDEQSQFVCNTEQPGCKNVCYDQAFPISLIRYWVLQVIFVSSPSLVYMGHAIYRLRALEKERHKKKAQLKGELERVEYELTEDRKRLERELRQLEQRKLNKAPLRGSLLCTYVIHIFTRSAVEVGFMVGQHLLYGVQLDPLYKCQRDPCPNVVDCFVSRPTEKTVFMLFMQSIAGVSLFLNILEIGHLGVKKIRKGGLVRYKFKDEFDDFYVMKPKKHSTVTHTGIGTSSSPHKTLPSAPSNYTLLMDKPNDPSVYPILNPPCGFHPIVDMRTENNSTCILDEQETKSANEVNPANMADNHFHNSSSNNNEKFTKTYIFDNKTPKSQPQRKSGCIRSSRSSVESALGISMGTMTEIPSEDTVDCSVQNVICSTTSNAVHKTRRISAPWHNSRMGDRCGFVQDSVSSSRGRYSFSANRSWALSKSDLKRISRPATPEALGEQSPEYKQDKECDGSVTFSPSRRMSLASNASSRRVPSDLQI